jgi:hypothetical protein
MTKQEKIQKMIDMQKKFTALEQEKGVDQVDYFKPEEGSVLEGYRQEYRDLSMSVVDDAHEEVGSKP